MPAVRLVVDFGDALADGGDDAAGVEHHARDGAVVGVGVVDGAGAEVPDLCVCERERGHVSDEQDYRGDLAGPFEEGPGRE